MKNWNVSAQLSEMSREAKAVYNTHTIPELKAELKRFGIKYTSKERKSELSDFATNYDYRHAIWVTVGAAVGRYMESAY